MTEITTPHFKCDFCGKKQFRKSDMVKHEKWCKLNPNNKHICFAYCKNLIKSEEDYEGISSDGEYLGRRTVFTCTALNQKMYSFIAERRKLPIIRDPDTIRMPLDCDKYVDQSAYNPFDDFEL